MRPARLLAPITTAARAASSCAIWRKLRVIGMTPRSQYGAIRRELVALFLDIRGLTDPSQGDRMIIDRETFTDIAKHLESASEGLLRAATGVATLCPEMDPGEPASLRWLALIESMVSVNGEITALETVLRAVLEANREEVAAARAGAVRERSS